MLLRNLQIDNAPKIDGTRCVTRQRVNVEPVPEQLSNVSRLRHGNRAGIPLLEHGRDCLEAPERELFGHPRGLSVLFATETWERFSYFGNSALVVLYMVQYLLQPGRIEGVIGFAADKIGRAHV